MVKVLLSNNDPGLRQALARAVESWGFQSIAIESAGDLRAVAAAERPDFILLDFVSPDGGALDLLQELRANPDTESIRVIILSTTDDPHDEPLCLQHGASYYFDSHWTLEGLRNRIQTMLTYRDKDNE